MDRFRANTLDVVFPFPGPDAQDVAKTLADNEIPVVWVGEGGPDANMQVGRILIERGSSVVDALEELMATGEGRLWQPSIENQSIIPVDINPTFLSPGRQRLLDEVYAAIATGELDIGTQPDT